MVPTTLAGKTFQKKNHSKVSALLGLQFTKGQVGCAEFRMKAKIPLKGSNVPAEGQFDKSSPNHHKNPPEHGLKKKPKTKKKKEKK